MQVHPGRDIPIGTLRAIERYLPVRSRKGMAPMSYTANVTRDGNDWLAEVRDLPGAHAFARTLAALRRELADAIILSADLPDGSPVEIDLVFDDPRLAGMQAAVDLSIERHRAAEVAASLTARTEEAARRLVGAGWSVRDVAGALDVTAGRVSQLTSERRPA